jgi:hypothetical protein
MIYPSISLVFYLSLITIESFNFINIQTEVDLFKKHKEPVPSNHNITFNEIVSNIIIP